MTNTPKVVRAYDNAFSAHLARTRLEASGIQAIVVGENHVTADPLLWIALGGVKVVVPATDLDAAREILMLDADADEARCAKCNSTALTYSRVARRSAFLTLLLVSFPFGRTTARVSCDDCKHTWRE